MRLDTSLSRRYSRIVIIVTKNCIRVVGLKKGVLVAFAAIRLRQGAIQSIKDDERRLSLSLLRQEKLIPLIAIGHYWVIPLVLEHVVGVQLLIVILVVVILKIRSIRRIHQSFERLALGSHGWGGGKVWFVLLLL